MMRGVTLRAVGAAIHVRHACHLRRNATMGGARMQHHWLG
jgi:hypothetical protein